MPVDFVFGELEEQKDAWKVAHDRAMECRDVEELIQRGIGLFFMLRLADESWTKKVQLDEAPFDAASVRELRKCYEWWLVPCGEVLDLLRDVEKSFEVENGDVFRRCVRLARRIVQIPLDDLIESIGQAQLNQCEQFV